MPKKFNTIIFDFDSTLVSIEGINELARMNGKINTVANLTRQAMDGALSFEQVFYKRLNLVKPNLNNLNQLANLYQRNVTKGARNVIAQLKKEGKKVMIITGGYKQAIQPTAEYLGIKPDDLWAIELQIDNEGYFTQVKPNHLQPNSNGKRDLIKFLNPKKKIVFIGDGSTDLLTQSVVDLFIGFGGVSSRKKIQQQANYYITQNSLLPIIDIIKKEEYARHSIHSR